MTLQKIQHSPPKLPQLVAQALIDALESGQIQVGQELPSERELAEKLGVDIINLHAAGGSKMMAAALEGLTEGSNGKRPLLIAVTQLTSTSQEVLEKELKGYNEYKKKVKYKMIPFIW